MDFTKDQEKAIESTASKLLIMSVAGSGKTTTLVERVRRLISKGVKPERILVMTFTNKMAQELKHKLPMLKWVGNFHSIGIRIINMYPEDAQISPGVTVISSLERDDIVEEFVAKTRLTLTKKQIDDAIKDYYKTIDTYWDRDRTRIRHQRITSFIKLLSEYFTKHNLVDFDNIEFKWLRILEKNGDCAKRLRNKFDHIIVDEFQDTSEVEDSILQAMKPKNICVVGDVFQNIYEFRGTVIENILRFKESADEVVSIDQSFRIPKKQTDYVNKIIAMNSIGYDMKVVSEGPGEGMKVVSTTWEDLPVELRSIVRMYSMVYSYKDIMILCRKNNQVKMMKEILYDLPTETAMSSAGWHSGIGKVLLSYLRYTMDTSNDYYTERFIRAIGLKSAIGIKSDIDYARFNNVPLTDVILDSMNNKDNTLKPEDEAASEVFKDIFHITKGDHSLEKKIHDIVRMIDLPHILGKNYDAGVCAQTVDGCIEMIDAFMKTQSSDLADVLDWLTTFNTQDMLLDKESIRIMTAHTAKGLEAKCVIIPYVIEDSFPMNRGSFDEELRLFYVAITRNSRDLILLHTGDSRFVDLE